MSGVGRIVRAVGRVAYPQNAVREPLLMLQLEHIMQRWVAGDVQVRNTFQTLGVNPVAGPATSPLLRPLTEIYDALGVALDSVQLKAVYDGHLDVLLSRGGPVDVGDNPNPPIRSP